MRYAMAAVPVVLLAAACGGGDSVALQPGQWETTIEFKNIEVPGAPEAQVAQMRQMMARPQTRSECITAEQAANPSGNMVNPQGGNCQFSENTFSGGRINVRGSCQQPGAGNVTMSMEGSYTATTMQADITSEVQAPQGAPPGSPQSVRMSGTYSSRRTGDCPGG